MGPQRMAASRAPRLRAWLARAWVRSSDLWQGVSVSAGIDTHPLKRHLGGLVPVDP